MSIVDRLWRKVNSNLDDFNAWVNLLDAAEKQPNIDVTRKVFDAFLVHFPYCYGYWKKYANVERHLGNKDRCLQIFEMGIKAIPLSIDLWVAYLDANLEIIHGYDDYEIRMRSLYEVALEKAGLEFRSDPLWEHYISWESGHNRLGRVLAIYDRLLRTPTQLYFQNWDSFKKLIEENRPEDFLPLGEFAELLARVSPVAGTAMRIALNDSSTSTVPIPDITEADRSAIRKLVIDRREKVYQATYLQIMKRWYFEEKIRRPYFHVKPLEEAQLNNWAEYLSFEESEAASAEALMGVPATDDPAAAQITLTDVQLAKKRVRILYERCLVACALYEHLWIRYAKYLEFTEQDISGAREVWRRACGVHLSTKPTIHWHWALFEARHPAELDENDGEDGKEVVVPISPLEILTKLEERLIDSALVCARRVDAMRREGKPLLDLIVCLRSGINRLRVRAIEQTSLAHTITGSTASFSAAIALATAAQARAGASYLAGKLARLLHRNVGNVVPPEGLPLWQLLLDSSYKPVPKESDSNFVVKAEGELEILPVVENNEKPTAIPTEVVEDSLVDLREERHQKEEEEEEMEVEDTEPTEVTPESLIVAPAKMSDGDTELGSDSPPVVMGRKKNTLTSGIVKPVEGEKRPFEEAEGATKTATSEGVDGCDRGDEGEEPQVKRKRRSRWGDVEGETDRDLANLRAAEAAAEAERLARADREQSAYASERAAITNVIPPSDPSSLPEEQRRLLSPEEAALAVLRDAIEFDPRNERLYTQLVDIAYQRQPLDVDGFVEFSNLAIVDSILPATIKLAFAQRKLQFLEEFSNDVNKISAAFDEYVQLAQLVVQCTTVGTGGAGDDAKKQSGGVDAPQAYNMPDLLNVILPAPLRPSPRRNPAPNGPVRRMPQVDIGAAILADAVAVGTPMAPPSTETAAAIRFTAGAYEPLAGASAGCLSPPAPTMVPIAAGALPGTEAVEVWRGLEPTGYAAAVASSYASGGGTFYAPMSASADATASVQAPPPALMTREGV